MTTPKSATPAELETYLRDCLTGIGLAEAWNPLWDAAAIRWALATIDRLRAELRKVEWGSFEAGIDGDRECCPSCDACQDDGHEDDCTLAEALAGATNEGDETR